MKDGPGDCAAGSARRLDRALKPGPFDRFTVSKISGDSLRDIMTPDLTARRAWKSAQLYTSGSRGAGSHRVYKAV